MSGIFWRAGRIELGLPAGHQNPPAIWKPSLNCVELEKRNVWKKRAKRHRRRQNDHLRITLRGRSEGQALPSARAYLFDRVGRLVDSKPVAADPVTFNVAAERAYRVTVGPELLAEAREPPANLEAQLAQAKALSQDFVPNGPSSAELRINPNIWICWFPTCINVHGTVTKQFTSGATTAICNGTVQIFQVDLGCTLDSFTVIDLASFRTRLIEKITLSSGVATRVSSERATLGAQ